MVVALKVQMLNLSLLSGAFSGFCIEIKHGQTRHGSHVVARRCLEAVTNVFSKVTQLPMAKWMRCAKLVDRKHIATQCFIPHLAPA